MSNSQCQMVEALRTIIFAACFPTRFFKVSGHDNNMGTF